MQEGYNKRNELAMCELEELSREELIEEYRCALACLCRQSAFLERYLDHMHNGRYVSRINLEKRLRYMEFSKEYLLKTKKLLGFTDGLAFMEDIYFQGFQFVGGKLSGDYTLLPQIIAGWLNSAEDNTEKNLMYEVAILVTIHYSFQQEEAKTNKSFFRKLFFRLLELIQMAHEHSLKGQSI